MEHVYIYISLLVIPLSVLVSYLVLNQWRFIRFSGSLKLAENQGHQLLLASEKNAREILDKAEVRASSEKESLKKKRRIDNGDIKPCHDFYCCSRRVPTQIEGKSWEIFG